MQTPDPGRTVAEAAQGPSYCFVGTLHLNRGQSPDQPLVGHLYTPVGVGVPLIQSSPTLLGDATLASLDNKQTTVCGNLMFYNGQLALHLAYASPGTNRITPGVSPLALVVLSLLGLLPASD